MRSANKAARKARHDAQDGPLKCGANKFSSSRASRIFMAARNPYARKYITAFAFSAHSRGMDSDEQHAISGLLRKRAEREKASVNVASAWRSSRTMLRRSIASGRLRLSGRAGRPNAARGSHHPFYRRKQAAFDECVLGLRGLLRQTMMIVKPQALVRQPRGRGPNRALEPRAGEQIN
jgi:hypothetical protein